MQQPPDWSQLSNQLINGDARALARCLSLVENEVNGYFNFLAALPQRTGGRITGITGPPGAGKSTLTNVLLKHMVAAGRKVAVFCVDPSSPFTRGAVLGDRIRMGEWYTHSQVFIRSLSSRGTMGGLHPKIMECTTVCLAAGYNHILIETVGVGQSEVEIAGLADTTVVVLVPEAGDEVQTMKAGLMEVADVFVVNKGDRPEADKFVRALQAMLAPAFSRQQQTVPILKTVATTGQGVDALYQALHQKIALRKNEAALLTDRAWVMISNHRMKNLSRPALMQAIEQNMQQPDWNFYRFVNSYLSPAQQAD